jgi:hypothetical protein
MTIKVRSQKRKQHINLADLAALQSCRERIPEGPPLFDPFSSQIGIRPLVYDQLSC